MASATELQDIHAHFGIKPAEMPRIHQDGKEPTYTSIQKFCEALERNAMSVPSRQTKLGHLALVISSEDFKDTNGGNSYKEPKDPGLSPTNPAASVTYTRRSNRTNSDKENVPANEAGSHISPSDQQAIDLLPYTAANAIREYTENLNEYRLYCATETALRNLIINATDDKYIAELKRPRSLYMLCTPGELLDHLWDKYGSIDKKDRSDNEKRMKAPWSPPEPIETLFRQLKEGQEFAKEGGETIDDEQIIRWGYELIDDNSEFKSQCEKWDDRESDEKTWKDFITYFTAAYRKVKKRQGTAPATTTGEAMYTANQVQEIVQNELTAMLNSIEHEKENTTAPPPLVANATAGLTAADITNIINAAIGKKPLGHNNHKREKSTRVQPKAQALLKDGTPVTYCWSHGVTRNLSHNSCTCTRRKDGHQDKATYDKRMNGSDNVYTSSK